MKAILKNALKVKIFSIKAGKDKESKFVDDCAVLWVILWPEHGTVQD